MYATYVYAAGSTAANILADVVKLLTGTTDKAQLSANCVQASTSIDASVNAAGWEVYDASAGTNARCLRAPIVDNGSQYKYLVVDTNSAGYIFFKLYESWNNSTHVGSYLAYNSDSTAYSQRLNTSTGGRLEVSASARHAVVFSLQNSAYGSSSGSCPGGVVERTRRSPWDVIANGYMPVIAFIGFGSYAAYEPRQVGETGSDETGSYAAVFPMHVFGGGAASLTSMPATTIPYDSTKSLLRHAFSPISFVNPANGHLGGDITSLCDIWLTTQTSGAAFDTVTYNSNTYVIWTSGTFRLAVRKG